MEGILTINSDCFHYLVIIRCLENILPFTRKLLKGSCYRLVNPEATVLYLQEIPIKLLSLKSSLIAVSKLRGRFSVLNSFEQFVFNSVSPLKVPLILLVWHFSLLLKSKFSFNCSYLVTFEDIYQVLQVMVVFHPQALFLEYFTSQTLLRNLICFHDFNSHT